MNSPRKSLGGLRRAALAVRAAIGLRELHFYGGLALVGAGNGRWSVVGGILVAHAILAPLLAPRKG